jgi:hypothetical protein
MGRQRFAAGLALAISTVVRCDFNALSVSSRAKVKAIIGVRFAQFVHRSLSKYFSRA